MGNSFSNNLLIGKKYAIEVSTRDITYFMYGDSEKDKDEWIGVIGRAIVQSSSTIIRDEEQAESDDEEDNSYRWLNWSSCRRELAASYPGIDLETPGNRQEMTYNCVSQSKIVPNLFTFPFYLQRSCFRLVLYVCRRDLERIYFSAELHVCWTEVLPEFANSCGVCHGFDSCDSFLRWAQCFATIWQSKPL